MKIGLAQINPTVGDFSRNAKRLVNAYREALDAGAELVISPECSLIGSPPHDLLLKSRFLPQSKAVLEEIAKEIQDAPLLVGYADTIPGAAHTFINAIAILHNGKISSRRELALLPTSKTFQEPPYPQPPHHNQLWEFKGLKIVITTTGGLWPGPSVAAPYSCLSPPAFTARATEEIDLILALCASPYQQGKQRGQIKQLRSLAQAAHAPLFYCNAYGGNGQHLFHGNSIAINAQGQIIGQAPPFQHHVLVTDSEESTTPPSPAASSLVPIEPMEELHHALVLGLTDYMHKGGFSKVCLELNGKIGPALTAYLATQALGPEHIHAFILSSSQTSQKHISDALQLSKLLGITCDTVPLPQTITAALSVQMTSREEPRQPDTERQIMARTRGLYLSSLSDDMGALLLSTVNKTELSLGLCTLYGDLCGGLSVIGDLPQTIVSELVHWINRKEELIPWQTIHKSPPAYPRPIHESPHTLSPDDETLDTILESYIQLHQSADDIIRNTGYTEPLVRWVQRRVDLHQWQLHQAPPFLHVTTEPPNIMHRMPIAQRFHD